MAVRFLVSSRRVLAAGPLALGLLLATAYSPLPQVLSCPEVAEATTRGGAQLPPDLAVPQAGACSLSRPNGGLVRVERVIDGDTVVIAGGERVRYIGIDTPELGDSEPYSRQALEANARLVQGKPVRLVRDTSDRDRFGRLLRYVFVDGIFVNAELVREGYAQAVAFPPDTAYASCLEALEGEARQGSRGIFSQ